MSNLEILKVRIKSIFPNMEDNEVEQLAKDYITSELLKRAKTLSPEQMKQEIGETY